MANTVYIVIVEHDYYPGGGINDWTWLTHDLEKAKLRAQAERHQYGSTYVVRIVPETLYYDVLAEYREDAQ